MNNPPSQAEKTPYFKLQSAYRGMICTKRSAWSAAES